MASSLNRLQVLVLLACAALGCSDRVELGSDLLWTADTESADLSQWATRVGEPVMLPSAETSVEVTSDASHGGRHAVRLTNAAAWDNEELGPELLHDAGALDDAYYSAWFFLPEEYRLREPLTIFQLRSRDAGSGELYAGEHLQLRSLASGGYVLQVFNNNAAFLLEPVAEQAPLLDSGVWFQLETRYERKTGGRLRVWLNGALSYDLEGRPGATGTEVVLSVCNVTEVASPAPLTLLVDDAAISAARVTPHGHLSLD